jgi:hypothetical protein
LEPAADQIASFRRLIRRAGTWLGVALIGLLCVYLSLASTAPASVARALGVDPADVYHPAVLGPPCVLLCLTLAAVSVLCIPFRLRHAGAWCSHVGVLVLAIGSLGYAVFRRSGDCAAIRTRAGWTPIRHVYLTRTFAAYVTAPNEPTPAETPLVGLDARGAAGVQQIDVPIAVPAEGVTVRATGFLGRARVSAEWRDVSPNRIPAVQFRITDGPDAAVALLSPSLPEFNQLPARGYAMVYRAGIGPTQLQRMIAPADPNAGPGMPHDLALMLTGPEIPPTLAVVRPDGTRWHGRMEVGKVLDVPLAGRTVQIEPMRFFQHAARVYEATADEPAGAAEDPGRPAGAVLKMQVRVGDWQRTTYVPFTAYEHLSPAQLMDLPDGRVVWLGFSRRRTPLPATVRITDAEYETYPASGIPKNYRCGVEVVSGGISRSETLSLNQPVQVGPFQLSQGSWEPPGARHPSRIFLVAASRPGLLVIWLGCILAALGFPIAFYVKPLLRPGRAQP